ncbi:MAG: TlpA disulfide reductase family protein [Flavobacteriales bacterium]|jgi:peroxiredoxin|nr:TlpA disulfide reductase family protein [Flavobacteriales bacterium]
MARPAAFLIITFACAVRPALLDAQVLSGTCAPCVPDHASVTLYALAGADTWPVAHAPLDTSGRFAFPPAHYPPGFYQLAVGDDDRVDIILDPREPEVRFRFEALPLQSAVTVERSRENAAMWAYKAMSRTAAMELDGIQEHRARTDAADHRILARLDSMRQRVELWKRHALDSVLATLPGGYFPHVVQADRRLMAALPQGPRAVRDAFGWADGRLLRSSIHPKALLAYLQSLPMDAPGGLAAGADSLLAWAAPDTACWRSARRTLLRAFTDFNVDHAAQHIVDRYVLGPGALLPPEDELVRIAAERLRVGVGAKAADVPLPDPITGDTVALAELMRGQRWTVLFFYSSTCDHCHEQMPGLAAMHREHAGRGVRIVGIALDTDKDEFLRCIAAFKLPWRGFSDLNGWGSPAARAFGIKATPALVVIDAEGVIAARPYDHVELRELLERTR